jgi:hypothetical protein
MLQLDEACQELRDFHFGIGIVSRAVVKAAQKGSNGRDTEFFRAAEPLGCSLAFCSNMIADLAPAGGVEAVLFHVVKLDLVDVHNGLHHGILQ